MRKILTWGFAAALSLFLAGTLHSQSAEKAGPGDAQVKDKLLGAWRLAWVEEQQPDGQMKRYSDRRGTIVYTPDGHMSVQIMLPERESVPGDNPVKYDQSGYEAYYGTYKVDEQSRTVTHHVEGALVRALVGKDLSRVYRFADGQLILRSSRSDEHWTIAWEHY
jgi:lipocalin-like protein